jgi:hypothetical protein
VSAGRTEPEKTTRDLTLLAPRFREAVERSLVECRALGLDVIVYETFRSQEVQAEYFARGRTIIPPSDTVTNAPSNLASWHGYGLAIDVISAARHWGPGPEWFENVAACFRANGCRWGGEWKRPDFPHFQWGLCKPSPSDRARELIMHGGPRAVWVAVSAV